MAKPILPTPPVYGEDAKALLESLKRSASRAEMAARIEHAKERLNSKSGSVVYTTSPANERRRRP